ncbi:hypothetical protein ACFXAF_26470, partial [Kitasatospora sp. NPDC059463]
MNRTPDLEAVRRADPTEVARRIVGRRDELGLDDSSLAHQAAMSPAYFRYLLAAGPAFDPAGFVRIAAALKMTWAELLEDRTDAPPGQSLPPEGTPRPLLLHLSEPECWLLVGTHGVGRVGLPGTPAPAVVPRKKALDRRAEGEPHTPPGAAPAAGPAAGAGAAADPEPPPARTTPPMAVAGTVWESWARSGTRTGPG